MKYIIASLLALSLAGCSKSDTNSNHGTTGVTTTDARNTTDYSKCGNQAPAFQSIEGEWTANFDAPPMTMEMTFNFSNNFLTVTNVCSLDGRSIAANVSTMASYNNPGQLELYRDDQDKQSIDEPNFKLNCVVNVSKSTAQYSFKGRCLVIQAGSDELVLLPK